MRVQLSQLKAPRDKSILQIESHEMAVRFAIKCNPGFDKFYFLLVVFSRHSDIAAVITSEALNSKYV